MDKTYIMLKDSPVLEINHYTCRILDYGLLPYSLRYPDVSFDDVMHGWTEARTMNIGKTNAKKLLAGLGIRQSNPYLIAKICHFASLTDCYWLKDESESITWDDVNLFKNPFEKAISATSLLGAPLPRLNRPRIHTPEITAQGMAAKAWIREDDGLYLYKVGRKELAASRILDVLGIDHVTYTEADDANIKKISDKRHIDKIKRLNEKIVKSKIITSEETSIVPWEEFQMYCEYHGADAYDEIRKIDPDGYYKMQIADYILSNEDRHGANWGLYMDNRTGALGKLYPLMDHDHAFSDEPVIFSQTTESPMTLEESAFDSVKYVDMDFSRLLVMEKPEELDEPQWTVVISNAAALAREQAKMKGR